MAPGFQMTGNGAMQTKGTEERKGKELAAEERQAACLTLAAEGRTKRKERRRMACWWPRCVAAQINRWGSSSIIMTYEGSRGGRRGGLDGRWTDDTAKQNQTGRWARIIMAHGLQTPKNGCSPPPAQLTSPLTLASSGRLVAFPSCQVAGLLGRGARWQAWAKP
ncbi:hypothetical protein BO71DRAFT_161625 [Aspergillus ellipticus CBS 707.79]|uniref:Uncharacterized protein n=1 Tax=Aspergillus ellipticus CBS 707.79 TaxID=1448320 RepID=A0A319DHA3_9EURO|nr:hypothetical protein BO71DRAFT_161625 [Aspergillus ellipticus CBS 707.79]